MGPSIGQDLDDDLRQLALAVAEPAPPFDSLGSHRSRKPRPPSRRGGIVVLVGVAGLVVFLAVVGASRYQSRGQQQVTAATDGGGPSMSGPPQTVTPPGTQEPPVSEVDQESLPGAWVSAEADGRWLVTMPDGSQVALEPSEPIEAVLSVTPLVDQSNVRLHTARLGLVPAMERLCDCEPTSLEPAVDGISVWKGLSTSHVYAGREVNGWTVIGEGAREAVLSDPDIAASDE